MVFMTSVEGSATGTKWVEGRDAAKLHTMHKTFPTMKTYLSPNNAKVEKPSCKPMELGMNELSDFAKGSQRPEKGYVSFYLGSARKPKSSTKENDLDRVRMTIEEAIILNIVISSYP